ncbi:3-hydroxyacyl-CoA dehydrogenase/enoyl-CoA hydratase family protein [Euryarchaeota archaeon]|uniref:Bifunctional 3-hydroxybutyryl-CoA dehydratase/3-hydroxyacyl-CoA dehydrogenase n=1 Tax=uncultured Poseidoniia archaeon TaxID=1697135 RepID=A0A1B1TD98_9ARCH|nr:bifunctional 3-hydroxybutyryl-CoA dehydratase/3-hydroxyacyl-CoA dehydrogenase [uncultured Candidatus Thalassoarchaea sp.]MAV19645.1 3-hydroxyacyl-CoA dehydrogenase [Euryarchaeota archaeon]MDA7603726.1 3-hydroxyacyl-CoA dehydrogenase/enoyl-CoA hydratase family protein [Euryarchaeota archaeon]|tara:strand:+ start:3049 stop:5115 length:2067 start_codon:yes stop_codon:yes gene_type:complete
MNTVNSVAIIGAGNMGSGIAQKSAQEQFNVQMVDREKQWVDRGEKIINDFLEEAIQRRIFKPEKVEEIKSRITGVVGTENVAPDTDLVIEAVFEDFNIKKDVFNILDRVCGDKTILASNTSSLSVNELAKATGRPDKFVGLHFFYHPAKNRLIEIIPAETTSPESLAAVEQYCKTMGKVVIICKDRPGFVVNRFFVPWLNEACHLVDEGVASIAQIDAVAEKAFNIGMGPFALMNLTGPSIALHATNYLAEQLNCARYYGAECLKQTIAESGMWDIGEITECDDETSQIISERLLGQVFAVSAQIVQEEICSIEDVDRGAKVGLRWAEGPFEIANKIGIKDAKRMAEKYAELAKFELPLWIKEREELFDFNYIDTKIDNDIATIVLNRPEAMNALNEEVVRQLGTVLDDLNSREEISTIVLEGAGKAFVAGADVKYFVDKIREDSIKDIYDFTSYGHEVLNKLEKSQKTTIALTTGLALGGGLELALSCDYRIGTRRSQFRFPETSIGIFPGLGGTQRTPRICGIEASRYAVLAGNFLDSKVASALGIITHLIDSAAINETVVTLSNAGKPQNKYPCQPKNIEHPISKFATEFYKNENMEEIMSGKIPKNFNGDEKLASRQIKSLGFTAPIALGIANELLNQAIETGDDLDAGLNKELSNLNTIFESEDALEGLSALIEGRRPSYTNS